MASPDFRVGSTPVSCLTTSWPIKKCVIKIVSRLRGGDQTSFGQSGLSPATMVSKRKSLDSQSTSLSIFENLRDVYNKKIKPVEEHCLFSKFGSPPLTDGELGAKPIVLLLGQYSTGKTSFIQHLLGRDYPGAHIGPEPTVNYR